MRRFLLLRLVSLVCGAAVLVSACAEPPRREMDQAQGAIDAARAARADRYATEEYQAAVSALKQAEAAAGQRDYRAALNYALDSRDRAQNAAKQAADQQAVVRSQAERALGEATALLDQANRRIAAAETARVPKHDLVEPRAAVSTADATVQKAGTAIVEGDYQAARESLSDTSRRLRAVIGALDEATAGRGARDRR